jgi:hypothetical protein
MKNYWKNIQGERGLMQRHKPFLKSYCSGVGAGGGNISCKSVNNF